MSDQRASAQTGSKKDVGFLLRAAVAATTAGAALAHLSAARDHPAHAHIAAFFVAAALAQFSAAALVAWRPSGRAVRWVTAGNLAMVAIWMASRTAGLPGIAGARAVEDVGVKDALTVFLELLAVGAGALLVALPERARVVPLPSADRAVAAVLAGSMALAVPAALAGHGHGAGHGVHGHREAAAAADGDHDHEDGDVHAQSGTVASEHVSHVERPDDHGSHAQVAGARVTAASGHGSHGPTSAAGSSHADHPAPRGSGGGATPTTFASAPGEATTVRYGPFTLPPASTNDARHRALISNTILTDLAPPCRNCFLTAIDFDLVYGDGRVANFDTGAMLHHHVMFNSGEDDPTCRRWNFDAGVGWLGRRIFASGNERTGGPFPAGYGYEVGGSDWWTGIFEIMNLVEQTQTVWVSVSVKHLPASAPVRAIEPIWLDADNCEDSEFAVPAGQSVTNWDWTSNVTGRVVLAGGHVHDGGTSISLANATTGERQCKSVARYGTIDAFRGHIESMNTCGWDRIGRVRKGEVLRLSTRYDVPQAQDDVMGIMMIWVHPTDDLDGGTAAPASVTDPPEPGSAPPPGGHRH